MYDYETNKVFDGNWSIYIVQQSFATCNIDFLLRDKLNAGGIKYEQHRPTTPRRGYSHVFPI